ncbi:transposase [uncultured Tyzzerella sp.]
MQCTSKVEALNNAIKVLKRIGFGFYNFEHLTKRVLLKHNLILG